MEHAGLSEKELKNMSRKNIVVERDMTRDFVEAGVSDARRAAGNPVTPVEYNLVDNLIFYEDGQLDAVSTEALFDYLRKTSIGKNLKATILQGCNMKLVKGIDLNNGQRAQVLDAFVWRLTTENGYPKRNPCGARVPAISDEQWLKDHAFFLTAGGKLSQSSTHQYCLPSYLADTEQEAAALRAYTNGGPL